jgi:hypothetical protein
VIIEIIPRVGAPPISLPITQFVVRQDNGTVIAVGADHGPQGTQAISMVGMPDFARIQAILGIDATVVHNLQLPKSRSPVRIEQGDT